MTASSKIPIPPLPEGAPGRPKGDRYREQYGVILICDGAEAQKTTFETLVELGFSPRVVVT